MHVDPSLSFQLGCFWRVIVLETRCQCLFVAMGTQIAASAEAEM